MAMVSYCSNPEAWKRIVFFAKVSRCVKLCDRSGVDSRMGSFSRTAMTAVWPFQCRTLSWLVFVLLWESRPWPNSRIKCSSSRPKRACSKYTATKKATATCMYIYIYIIYYSFLPYSHLAVMSFRFASPPVSFGGQAAKKRDRQWDQMQRQNPRGFAR